MGFKQLRQIVGDGGILGMRAHHEAGEAIAVVVLFLFVGQVDAFVS
jgi:hypothetical protein